MTTNDDTTESGSEVDLLRQRVLALEVMCRQLANKLHLLEVRSRYITKSMERDKAVNKE
jgi:hypothetical protein